VASGGLPFAKIANDSLDFSRRIRERIEDGVFEMNTAALKCIHVFELFEKSVVLLIAHSPFHVSQLTDALACPLCPARKKSGRICERR
jgi:hypothetical protein